MKFTIKVNNLFKNQVGGSKEITNSSQLFYNHVSEELNKKNINFVVLNNFIGYGDLSSNYYYQHNSAANKALKELTEYKNSFSLKTKEDFLNELKKKDREITVTLGEKLQDNWSPNGQSGQQYTIYKGTYAPVINFTSLHSIKDIDTKYDRFLQKIEEGDFGPPRAMGDGKAVKLNEFNFSFMGQQIWFKLPVNSSTGYIWHDQNNESLKSDYNLNDAIIIRKIAYIPDSLDPEIAGSGGNYLFQVVCIDYNILNDNEINLEWKKKSANDSLGKLLNITFKIKDSNEQFQPPKLKQELHDMIAEFAGSKCTNNPDNKIIVNDCPIHSTGYLHRKWDQTPTKDNNQAM